MSLLDVLSAAAQRLSSVLGLREFLASGQTSRIRRI